MDQSSIAIAAAILTSTAIAEQANSGAIKAMIPPNPNPSDINTQVWETFRVFYHGLIGAAADATDWPQPQRGPLPGKVLPSTPPSTN